MNAFRGTLIAAVAVVILGLSIWIFAPEVLTLEDETVPVLVEGRLLVEFEEHELVSVRIERPNDVIELHEADDGTWSIEGTGFDASRSMVSRIRHQLHALSARALVTEAVTDPDRYGLGDSAIRIVLGLQDGREIALLAGDPNPSTVSYYVQPLPGTAVYTVQKAAVDYFSGEIDRFREARFAQLDIDAVTRLEITSTFEGAPESLVFQRRGEESWWMEEPISMDGGDEQIRRLLGRVQGLRANRFIEPDEQSGELGLSSPRSVWRIETDTGETTELIVGASSPDASNLEDLAYFRLGEMDTVYVARAGLLEELLVEPEHFRNRRMITTSAVDVVAIRARLRGEEDEELAGEQEVRFSQQWLWSDGVPVAGMTPGLLRDAITGMTISTFLDDHPEDLVPYGLDNPVARVWIEDVDGRTTEIRFGREGEPEIGLEGAESPRRHVSVEGRESVYLVDARVLDRVRDLIREGNRRDEQNLERSNRGGTSETEQEEP